LGIKEVIFLDYIDSFLDDADHTVIVPILAQHIQRIRPQVVITFDPYGGYGHPDHIAICQFTTAAVMQATVGNSATAAHQVQKLYYLVDTKASLAIYEEAFGELSMTVDGIKRDVIGWTEWSITTRIDIASHWETVWKAVNCHQSQIESIETLKAVAGNRPVWQTETYYRVFSTVNSGREPETDLFAGIPAEQNAPDSLLSHLSHL
ncbi:MAG: PIG-L family deacetylase, partial [Chloroflexota bacterium]